MRAALVTLFLASMALAQGLMGQAVTKAGIPLIVPGSELGWRDAELRLVVRVEEPGEVWLQMYSPGFDPKDYRSAHELGDERYDGGKGDLLAVYELWQGKRLIVRKTFGEEPHRWATLFRGRLEPGEYRVTARFFGNGKNAVIFHLKALSGRARLLLAPGSMQTYNVVRGGWQTPFTLGVSQPSPGLKVGIYDGDGPRELEMAVRTPTGELRPEVSGNLAWTYVKTEAPGRYAFRFRIPKTAKQHTNTVGFKVFLGPIRVAIVDPEGRPVPGASYRLEGAYTRRVVLERPEGWRLVRTEVKNGEVEAPGLAVFGMGAGSVRFVLKRMAPLARLRVEAVAACGDWRAPYPLKLRVGERRLQLSEEGKAELSLPAGVYPLTPEPVPGARLEGDARVSLTAGGTATARWFVHPEVKLAIRVEGEGPTRRVVVEAGTAFPLAVPARLRVELPEGLEAQGPVEARGAIGSGRRLRLVVPVRVQRPGDYQVRARLLPCGVTAAAPLSAAAPARFSLEKRALTPEVAVGEEAAFEIVVKNKGGKPGRVRLLDPAPKGFEGPSLDEELELAPGAAVRRVVRGRVAAGPEIRNRVTLVAGGRTLAEAEATVRVRTPSARLTRSLDKPVVLPGERVRVCLRVENPGAALLRYRLEDRPPAWAEPEEAPVFTGALSPGGAANHCYLARVAPGPEAEGVFHARLTGNAGTLTADDRLRRVQAGLEKVAEPSKVLLGREVHFGIRVKNPLDRPVVLKLVDEPDPGLGLEGFSRTLDLGPGETKTLTEKAVPTRVGRWVNRARLTLGSVPVAPPVEAGVEVVPPLVPERESTVELRFAVEGTGDALLLRHAPPQGARYLAGSSRLDGRPIPDPRVDDQGRLYWRLPFAKQGRLTYRLAHTGPLPPLPDPELTLLRGGTALPLQGKLKPEDYRRARPIAQEPRRGLIQEPAPGTVFAAEDRARVVVEVPEGAPVALLINGRPLPEWLAPKVQAGSKPGLERRIYDGVPLAVGRNLIEARAGDRTDRVEVFRSGPPVRAQLVPVHAVADGRSPLRFELRFLDAQGLPAGEGLATVATDPEPLTPDADLGTSGHQIRVKGGVAELALRPTVVAGEVKVRARFAGLEAELAHFVPGPARSFYLAQGSVTVRYHAGAWEVGGLARGYLEAPLADGRLQAALGQTFAQGRRYPGLDRPENPTGRFPLTGAGEEARLPLVSEDGIAFRYDRGDFSVGYGRGVLAPPALVLPKASALAAEYRGPVRLGAFVALLARQAVTVRLTPDGTRVYDLGQAVRVGSEEVWLVRGGEREKLVPLRDYVLDYPTGTLYFSHPIWPTDANLVPQTLVVSFAPETAPRDRVAFGASAELKAGRFGLRAAVATLDGGAQYRFGLEARYQVEHLRVVAGYRYAEGAGEATLAAEGEAGPVKAEANLRYRDRLTGRARVAAELGGGNRVALEHEGRAGQNETGLYLEHRFTQNLFAGVGAGYRWEEGALALLGRAGYQRKDFSVRLTHSQAFAADPETRLALRYALDANLTLKSDLAYRWGLGLIGVVGLDQKLGPANLALSYRLPGASGEGNRARFGVRAPLPLDERWSLDLSAGVERDFTTSATLYGAGVGVRYRTEDFSASFGVEGATGSAGDKVTLRAGAAGQIDRRQVLSVDANYVLLPEARGKFTLAYAYRGRVLQALTYHRLVTGADSGLEGELAAAWHPGLAFQLRPSVAYRLRFADPGANLYQGGLGFNYYPTRVLGLGAGGYYLYQPATDTGHLAFSVEGSLRVLEPVWLNLGYTFGGFAGLTPEARPGLYLRLDFLTGTDP